MISASSVVEDTDQTSQAEKQLQAKKLDELIGILLSAGYFRARVASLTPFDKVVGGMCWCLSSSGAAVDVDIFYEDNPNLGRKMCVCCAALPPCLHPSIPASLPPSLLHYHLLTNRERRRR